MKILLVTWHFPPVNTVAALRTGKLAEFLANQGVEVTVVTSRKQSDEKSLSLNSDKIKTIETEYVDLDRWLNPVSVLRRIKGAIFPAKKPIDSGEPAVSSVKKESDADQPKSEPSFLWRFFSSIFTDVILFPDKYLGWFLTLYPAIVREAKESRPDFIIVTGPPFTPFLATALAAKRCKINWIGEYRDRWMDDPYAEWPQWRRRFDHWFEKKLLSSASAIVTVSPKWKRYFENKFRRPVGIFLNGYDPESFDVEPTLSHEGLPLLVTHMGRCYPNRRDPSQLFEALSRGRFTPDEIKFRFYGWALEYVEEKVREYGVEEFVEILPPVPYKESIALQTGGDALLLMQWNNKADEGNIPAKLFEYLAAKRPIIAVGCETGFVAEEIHRRNAGLLSNDPDKLAAKLREWVEEKKEKKRLPILPESCRKGLSRGEQLAQYQGFLERGVQENRNRRSSERRQSTNRFRAGDRDIKPVASDKLEQPLASIIVDTEEDFNWFAPFRRTGHEVSSVSSQHLAQDIFDRYGIKPSYLIDYAVLENSEASEIFRNLHEQGKCELGVQLHPWINPPYKEWLNSNNSFPHNLEQELFDEKLEALTALFENRFGFSPVVFKSGRYGLDRNCLDALRQKGFLVDTSLIPWSSYSEQGGPNFLGAPSSPFWFGQDPGILELPVTRGLEGLLSGTPAEHLFSLTHTGFGTSINLAGLMTKTGLLERVTLSPEGNTFRSHKRLVEKALSRNQKIFFYNYHSPSLATGNTPYVRTEADLEKFLERIDNFCAFFIKDVGGRFVTPQEMHTIFADFEED